MVKDVVKKESVWIKAIKRSGVYQALEKVADDQKTQIKGLTRENRRMADLVDQKLQDQLLEEIDAGDTMDVVRNGEIVTRKMDRREKEVSAMTTLATMSIASLPDRLRDANTSRLQGNLNRAVEVSTDIEADLTQIKELSELIFEENPKLLIAKKLIELSTRAHRRLVMIYPKNDRERTSS